MSDTIRVIDLSEWTGPVPVQNARRMVDEYNVEGVILQAWGSGHILGRRNEYFHQAAAAFRMAGITNIDPYIWPPSEWRQAISWIEAGGDYKRTMSGAAYLDVEAGAGVTDDIISGVRAAGWEPRIYASPSSWAGIMGNTTRYKHLKLWLARYLLKFQLSDGYYRLGFDGVAFPTLAFDRNVGGWLTKDLVGWQTTGTVPNFCGESVDCSIFHRDAFKQEEEDDMVSQAEFDKLRDEVRAVNDLQNKYLVGHKAAIDLHSEIVIDLEKRLEALSGLVSLLEAKIKIPGNSANWQGALSAHASDPDGHHE